MFSVGHSRLFAVALTAALLLIPSLPLLKPATAQSPATDGRLDPTFGTDGRIVYDTILPANNHAILDLQVLPDGRIVTLATAYGIAGNKVYLTRSLPDGSADNSFGQGGQVSLGAMGGYASSLEKASLSLQPNGDAIVSAQQYFFPIPNPSAQPFPVWRVLSTGVLDAAFPAAPPEAPRRYAAPFATLRDGRLVQVGVDSESGVRNRVLVVRRFTPDGGIDRAFGEDGVAERSIGASERISVETPFLLANGKLLITGTFLEAGKTAPKILLARLLSTGEFDGDFGDGGHRLIDIGNNSSGLLVGRIQPMLDGRTLVRAIEPGGPNSDFGYRLIWRFLADGTPDASFGTSGRTERTSVEYYASATGLLAGTTDDGVIFHSGNMAPFVPVFTRTLGSLYKLDRTGKFDFSFGPSILGSYEIPWMESFRQVADGTLIIGGNEQRTFLSRHHRESGHTLMRLDGAGKPIPSFGVGGMVIRPLAYDGFMPATGAALVDPKGFVAIGGSSANCATFPGGTWPNNAASCAAVLRIRPDGALDPAFSGWGLPPWGVSESPESGANMTNLTAMANGTVAALGSLGPDALALSSGVAVASILADGRIQRVSGDAWPTDKTFSPIGLVAQSDGGALLLSAATPKGEPSFIRNFSVVRFSPGLVPPSPFPDIAASAIPGSERVWPYQFLPYPGDRAMAIGQIDSAGVIARYRADGTFDTTFGKGGVLTTTLGLNLLSFQGAAVQPDGALLVAGIGSDSTRGGYFIARLLPSGAFDPTFGVGGTAFIPYGNAIAHPVLPLVLLPDGRFLFAANRYLYPSLCCNQPFPPSPLLARFLPNGSLDQTFGNGGFVENNFSGVLDRVESMVVQPDGKLLVIGTASLQGKPASMAIARLTNIDLAHYTRVANVLLRFPVK